MKNSKIFWFIGVFLIGLGGGMIHIGLGIMAAGFMSLFCSYLEFEKEEKDGNKNHEEANTESDRR
jgi:hypothetical protein